jgi:hypothetical protein
VFFPPFAGAQGVLRGEFAGPIPVPAYNHEESAMSNVNAKIEGNLLTLTVDISPNAMKAAQPSKAGLAKAKEKGLDPTTVNRVLSSTEGFMSVGNGIRVSLNAIVPPL